MILGVVGPTMGVVAVAAIHFTTLLHPIASVAPIEPDADRAARESERALAALEDRPIAAPANVAPVAVAPAPGPVDVAPAGMAQDMPTQALLDPQVAAMLPTIKQVPELALADFGSMKPSPAAREMADWIVSRHDNGRLPFVVLDKRDARLYVFQPERRLVESAPVLLGSARGDETWPGIGNVPIKDVKPYQRTTAAGRFVTQPGVDLDRKDVVWLDYDAGLAMHRVINKVRAERRPERLASPSPADNRISFGCINVPIDFFDRVVSPMFGKRTGVAYVIPETKTFHEAFEEHAGKARRELRRARPQAPKASRLIAGGRRRGHRAAASARAPRRSPMNMSDIPDRGRRGARAATRLHAGTLRRAHLSPARLCLTHPRAFAYRVLCGFRANQGLLLAGAVAYYSLLSIVPLLILSVIALSHVLPEGEVLETVGRYLGWVVPSQSNAIQGELAAFLAHKEIVGWLLLATMLFFSSLAFAVLENAMSVIFIHRVAHRKRPLLASLLLPYAYIFCLALGLLVVTLVAGGLEALGTHTIDFLGHRWSLDRFSRVLLYLVGLAGEIVALTAVYLVMPSGRLDVRHALFGAVAAAALWEVTRHVLLWYYATLSQVTVVYGSMTTAIVVLLSLELGATLLLLGAQVISEYERLVHHAGKPPPADLVRIDGDCAGRGTNPARALGARKRLR